MPDPQKAWLQLQLLICGRLWAKSTSVPGVLLRAGGQGRRANGATISVEKGRKAAAIASATASAAPGFGYRVLHAPSRCDSRD